MVDPPDDDDSFEPLEQEELQINEETMKNIKGTTVWLDRWLYNCLCWIKRYVRRQDGDCLLLITGLPGTGKSTIAQQIGRFFDPLFDKNSLAFNPSQFKEKVMTF